MKTFTDFILETKGDPIDDQWINDEKPVMTKDGRQAIIRQVDMENIPNHILGSVKINTDLYEYEWLEDGTCVKAVDRIGNPKKPDVSDNLVKAI